MPEDRASTTHAVLPALLYGLLTAGLLAGRNATHPDLHTILDTAVCLLGGILALLLWDVGSRSAAAPVRGLALCFGVTALLELLHTAVALPWPAPDSLIGSEARLFRPISWPPAAYLLPLGILGVHATWRRPRISTVSFGGGLALASVALYGLFFRLPPYAPPNTLGMTRPFLAAVPVLWLAAGAWSWARRADRVFAALVPTTAFMLIGHSFMAFSRFPHDTMAMVAHLGKAAGTALFLVRLTQMGAAEMQQRLAAEHELRAANEELEGQYRRVQESSRVKSEFLANMSHELRTPLNAVIGFAELLHDGKVGLVRSEQKELLADILTSSWHLRQLIDDILDLSKVEAGRMEFHPEPVEMAKVVGEVRGVLRSIAAGRRIRVETEIDAGLGEVVTDPGKLKQVLYNYLSNALKFTPEEGRVTIRVAPEGTDRFRLEVEDTGIGIKAEDLKRLFVDFQQLDASPAKKHAGTGLGLALTKRLVEAQGGRVEARSVPGQGSTFSAILPREPFATQAT